MSDYQASKFKQRQMGSGYEVFNRTAEQLDSKFGTDMTFQNMKQSETIKADDIFKERFEEVPIAKTEVEEKIARTYAAVNRGQSLSNMQKGKRADSAIKKTSLVKHMRDEKKLYLERKEGDNELLSKYLTDKQLSDIEALDTEEKASMRELLLGFHTYAPDNTQIMGELLDENISKRVDTMVRVIKQHQDVPLEKFAYDSDEDFISGFAEKYDEIVKQVALKPLLKNLLEGAEKEEDKGDAQGLPIAKLLARVEVFEQMKQDYEDRMELISSPYYALLAGKDMKQYKSESDIAPDADPEFAEYVRRYIRLSNNSFGKGADIKSAYKAVLKQRSVERCERDVGVISSIVGRTSMTVDVKKKYTEEEKDRRYAEFYNQIGQSIMDDLAHDTDEVFVEKEKLDMDGLLTDGLSAEDFTLYEKTLLDILKNKKSGGQKIDKEVLDSVDKVFRRYALRKRRFVAYMKTDDLVNRTADNFGVDVYNEEFLKTKEYAMLQSFNSENGLPEAIIERRANVKSDCIKTLFEAFKTLSSAGYPIALEESALVTEEAALIEASRKKKQDEYYREHPLNEGEEPATINFNTFTFNGKTYTDYETSPFMAILAEKKVGDLSQVPGEAEDKEHAIMYMEALDKYQKELCVLDAKFKGKSGIGGLIYTSRKAVLMEEKNKMENGLKDKLLKLGLF